MTRILKKDLEEIPPYKTRRGLAAALAAAGVKMSEPNFYKKIKDPIAPIAAYNAELGGWKLNVEVAWKYCQDLSGQPLDPTRNERAKETKERIDQAKAAALEARVRSELRKEYKELGRLINRDDLIGQVSILAAACQRDLIDRLRASAPELIDLVGGDVSRSAALIAQVRILIRQSLAAIYAPENLRLTVDPTTDSSSTDD